MTRLAHTMIRSGIRVGHEGGRVVSLTTTFMTTSSSVTRPFSTSRRLMNSWVATFHRQHGVSVASLPRQPENITITSCRCVSTTKNDNETESTIDSTKNAQEVTVDVEYGNTDDDNEENDGENKNKKAKDHVDPSLFTEEIEIRMPDMGEGTGKVVKWFKQEGDLIQWQDTLCDIETPDFTFGMMTEDEGDTIMGKIHVEAGSDPVEDGAVLCTTLHKPEHAEEKGNESE